MRRSTMPGADRSPPALLAIVGVVNVPIIYFSVKWWNTLHQGASVSLTKAPSMATPMLIGMLVMALAFWAYCIMAVALVRVRTIILERERHTVWARQLVAVGMNFELVRFPVAMGGYGLYVWGSMGMCAAAIVAELAC
jgi:hypothetical protein